MPPRKSSRNNKITENKSTRGRAKSDKINSKSPANIKIVVAVSKSSESSRRVTRKQILSNEAKIALANEVVTYQLKKKTGITNFDNKVPIVDATDNRGKAKTVVSKFFDPQNVPDGKTNKNQKKKGPRATSTKIKKEVIKKETNKKPPTRKRSADSTQNTEKCTTVQKNNVQPKRRRAPENRVIGRKVPEKGTIEGKDNVTDELKNKRKVSSSTVVNVQADEAQCPVSMYAGHIDSRKTSSTSTSSTSWTKDLFSSNRTSVNVTTNDFVRIDNKVPMLQLTSIDNKLIHEIKQPIHDKDNLLGDSDSSDSTNSEKSIDIFDIKSINLSTSSLTSLSNINNGKSYHNNTKRKELNKAFDKLTSKLNHFDIEMMSWIGCGKENTDVNMKDFQDKILKTLKEECEVITHCRHLKIILTKDVNSKPYEKESEEIVDETHAVNMEPISRNIPEYVSKCTNNVVQVVNKSLSETDCHHDTDYVKFKNNETYDDDDAISIYAESITGIESEKLNNSITLASKELENLEYIPEPIKKTETKHNKYTYRPTKITENSQLAFKKTVCEKQNADSTSIFKENNFEQGSEEGEITSNSSENSQDNLINGSITKIAELPQAVVNRETTLENYVHKSQDNSSFIFKNICHFNLFYRCKNSRCRFLHIIPDILEVKKKLCALNDEAFISEYTAIRKVFPVFRKYGICFVQECCNRNMTRVLLNMVKCFFMISKIKDEITEVLECILLKLNTVDLNVCEDLLMESVTSTMRLCDLFMQAIAESQNFSRFKLVFLNLTHFIVSRNGKFNFLVAESILERVCILPSERPLYRALLDIIKNTDAAIFRNNMIGKFENMLLTLDKKLHGDLLAIKMEAVGCLLSSPSDSNASAKYNNNLERTKPMNTFINVGDKSYTSPDTTDYNSLINKLPCDMKTRTVNFKNAHNIKESNKSNQPNHNNEKNWQKTGNFNRWNRKTPHHNTPPPLLSMPVAMPVLHQITSKRHVAYKSPITAYQRRPLKDF